MFKQLAAAPPVAVTMREIRLALFSYLGIGEEVEARIPTDEELDALSGGR